MREGFYSNIYLSAILRALTRRGLARRIESIVKTVLLAAKYELHCHPFAAILRLINRLRPIFAMTKVAVGRGRFMKFVDKPKYLLPYQRSRAASDYIVHYLTREPRLNLSHRPKILKLTRLREHLIAKFGRILQTHPRKLHVSKLARDEFALVLSSRGILRSQYVSADSK